MKSLFVQLALMIGAIFPAALPAHTLDFDSDARSRQLVIASKDYNNGQVQLTDRVFRDGHGREVVMRGWNVSGATKLVETGFKPFRNTTDARDALTALRARTGANVVRFLIAWEGVNPAPDQIDAAYLDAVAEQIREAIRLRMFVLVDWHQDLFASALFNKASWHTGNGAPAWVIVGGSYPAEYCGMVCTSWAQHNLTDEAVRRAFRNFWNNATIATPVGLRRMQDVYLWQMEQTLRHLKLALTPAEFDHVLGVDPFNEPVDGGMEGLTAAQWDNQKLWPFYHKVRTMMDDIGWYEKPVYAEPLVYWNTNVGFVAPATGGKHLIETPVRGFVFNAHFYEAGRQALDTRPVNNGSYLQEMHQVRDEGRYLRMPVFLSEFGVARGGSGRMDSSRVVNAMYQGMESSDSLKLAKDRFADAYSPPVSGTQWHWNWYHDRHHEYMNGNPDKLLTTKDAWNEEDFSAITVQANGSIRYGYDERSIERIFPRAVQGDVMSFHYNALARDAGAGVLNWLALRPIVGDTEYFRNDRWALLSWRGRRSDAPTEIFLPASFQGENIVIVTDRRIVRAPALRNTPTGEANEVMLTTDNAGGQRLLVWDDVDAGEDANTWHYVLVVRRDSGEDTDSARLSRLKNELDRTIVNGRLSPVYFTGAMTQGGYVADTAPRALTLSGNTYQVLWWKYVNFGWEGATGEVDILVNGSRVQSGGANDGRSAWNYSGETRYQVCERGGRRCSNTLVVR